jgi:hypothetical protein
MIDRATAYGWQRLTDAEQARLRFSLMRELSWIDWDHEECWWWEKIHVDLLELKLACALVRPDAERGDVEPQPS